MRSKVFFFLLETNLVTRIQTFDCFQDVPQDDHPWCSWVEPEAADRHRSPHAWLHTHCWKGSRPRWWAHSPPLGSLQTEDTSISITKPSYVKFHWWGCVLMYLAEPWPARFGRNGRHQRLWGWRASRWGRCSGCLPRWRPACGGCQSCTPLSRSAGDAQKKALSLQAWRSTSVTRSEIDNSTTWMPVLIDISLSRVIFCKPYFSTAWSTLSLWNIKGTTPLVYTRLIKCRVFV